MSPEEKINFFRGIVAEKQYRKTPEGFLVDLFTASLVCQIYDSLTPERQTKFLSLDISRICLLSLELVS